MHKADIQILQVLKKNECNSEIKSFTINQIKTHIDYSYSKLHNNLNSLVVGEYVQKGFKNSRADTYYISVKGLEKLKILTRG